MQRVLRIANLLFTYGFGGVILILLAVYVWSAFLTREIGVAKYEKEFLAATLFWLVGLALAQVVGLASGKRSLTSMEADLAVLARAAAEASAAPEVRFYEGDEVYEAACRAVGEARQRVWVTYLRGETPRRSNVAEKYFDACRKWAMLAPERSFRRIVLHCDKPAMSDFYAAEHRAVRDAHERKHDYQVKLLKGSVHATEAISVGIFDDVVMFTHKAGPDHVFGVSIRSRRLANQHIREYYNRLWNLDQTRPIEEIFPAT